MNRIEQSLTSMEVAEMVGKDHNKLLRDVREYCNQLSLSKIGQSDFFVESTYRTERGKEYPCYNVTKKGCEFIAHKLTGIKGTAFTARYINRFHEMEEQLQRENHMDWFVNDIRVFQHREFGILRTLQLDGQDYFVGIDVTRSLGYVNNTDTLKKRVSNTEKCYVGICDGNRTRKMVVITKKGLEELIKTGRLPLAEKYREWLVNQVYPTLSGTAVVPVSVTTEPVADALPGKTEENKGFVIPEMKNPIRIFRGLLKLADDKGFSVNSFPFQACRSLLQDTKIGIRKGLSLEETIFELAYELSHALIHCDCGDMINSPLRKDYDAQAERAACAMIELLNVNRA